MENELISILRSEVKPALGCTGPIGVCYCAAQAYDAIGGEIEQIHARIDWGLCTKIDDVAYPGTQMPGVEMAVALGAICGDPAAGLEVLHNVKPECELKARKLAKCVIIQPMWERTDLGIYVEITVVSSEGIGRAIIAHRSDGLILKERNGKVLFEAEEDASAQSGESPILKYKIKDLYELAAKIPVKSLRFMKDAVEYNTRLSSETLVNNIGAGIGAALYACKDSNRITRAKAWAAAGCEARMSGTNIPTMSCANKGNVGIAASMPLVSLAKDLDVPQERLLRAITLSYLISIAIIHRIGKSPAMCSCEVAASLGIAAGSVLLQGGTEEQAEIAIQNTIPNVFGVVCDGAKLACAMRISSGTGIGFEAADLALAGVRFADNQGVLGNTADDSIDIMGRTALFGMVDSDRELCRQLFEKRKLFPLKNFSEHQQQ